MKSSLVYAFGGFAIVALLALGYLAARPPTDPATSAAAPARTGTQFEVRIGAAAEAESTPLPVLPVARGDIVSIAVSSAQAGQLMIHGYMQEMVPVAAGQTATLRLAALHAGRYPLHLHGDDQSHREVAILEIRP
jgi:hypothetical protein